ncbi:hypothetical protein CHGG_06231 [Chaetomium globosum CBS 148.51]|uniref:Uncharacterized protein n=1 Tax=Chaetomium globosum (strain ATCC 6205 / CBS 148.51 / DSM 1962 / NBRC 6347 / NRRL 1970) TaxID=306901 RepID=Q2H534_CHAGB|nr:uncharacterized protein CHGG_06231 [Chaetomium globosum CBS 148.51]EAQ89612.1 hypothetical protein CHGG_06231 [Chaetomium globosum CBS 148.51]
MSFIEGWAQKPFPTLAFSAGGVLALADLQTIAQRTALTGGASWMDTLLLAPGIHYQQAADELFRKGGAGAIIDVVDELDGSAVVFKLNNAATAHYIQNVAKPGETVTLDVGRAVAARGRYKLHRSESGDTATAWRETQVTDFGWISHALYLAGPVLTIAAITFIVLFKDWWALMSILALMTSRLLNIWVIKQRASHADKSEHGQRSTPDSNNNKRLRSPSPSTVRRSSASRQTAGRNSSERRHRLSFSATRQRISQFLVRLNDAEHRTMVRLRGKASDIRDVTTRSWLRRKTHLEGYLEATAKLIVYLVAALSGNMTQSGSMVMMAVLLATAGLPAVSNAKAKKLVVNGAPVGVAADGEGGKAGGGGTAAGGGGGNGGAVASQSGARPAPFASVAGGRVAEAGRGRPRQANGGATAAVMDPREGRPAPGPGGMRRGGGNQEDLAERGQAGHVRFNR